MQHRSDESDPRIVPGTLIGGKYAVDGLLGQGAMGLVVAAVDPETEERVALKLLKRDSLANPEIVARFVEEARTAALLEGDHVGRIRSVGFGDDGSPYLVMEALSGMDLAKKLASTGPSPIEDAAKWILHACEGLADAHARGLVHGNVKPTNLFLVEPGGCVKVLDFGLSKAALLAEEVEASLSILGSPCYASPEQLRGRETDHRADIWSLGVVLFELLTQETPYPRHLPTAALLATILDSSPPDLRSLRADTPAALEQIVVKCLAKDPAERFQTTAELAAALRSFAPAIAKRVDEVATAATPRAAPRARDSVPSSSMRHEVIASLRAQPAGVIPTPAPSHLVVTRSTSDGPETGPSVSGFRHRAVRPVAALGAAVLAVLIGVALFGRQGEGPISATSAARAAEPFPAAPPTRVAAHLSKMRITSDPSGAAVREDGSLLCAATPCEVFYAPGDGPEGHLLVLQKSGYAPKTISVNVESGHADAVLSASGASEPPSEPPTARP